MSDTRNHTTRDQLAEIFNSHAYDYPDSFCACGQWFKNPWEEHAPHLADAILASDAIAAVRAAAVAETTAAIEAALAPLEADGDYNPYADIRAALSGGRTALDTTLAQARAEALREAADELDAVWNEIDREHPAGAGSPDPYWEGRLAGIEQAETRLRDRADTGADQ